MEDLKFLADDPNFLVGIEKILSEILRDAGDLEDLAKILGDLGKPELAVFIKARATGNIYAAMRIGRLLKVPVGDGTGVADR